MELAILNRIDRFSLVMDVLKYIPTLKNAQVVKAEIQRQQQAARDYAHQYGIDMPELENWTWPYAQN